LSAFPQTPNERDIEYLLDRTKQIAGLNRTLAIEAMDKALKAAQSKEELREIAAILGSIDPELLKRYQTEHDDLAAAMSAKDPSPRAEEKQELNTPDLTNLSYLDALTEVRKLTNPAERAGLLIELYRRDGITQQQRAMVASEALAAVSAMPLSNDKLIGMAMISRDHARNSDPANAAFAAELLAETYAKACDCGNGRCRHSDETFDCLSMVNDFALYLDEFKITPESLALNNISLEVRLLMLKLYPLLNLKPPSLWSLGN